MLPQPTADPHATVASDVKSPALFRGGSEGMRWAATLQGCIQAAMDVPRIMPSRPEKGQSKGFDQSERVAVFWLLFCVKRVTAVWGAEPHPVPRSGSAR